ncbi:MAG TPA: hypothetical protein DCL10_04165, partial [Acidimicrobium sp.]|nr:hypothetical protein [Acidimicrobium sp.]
MIIASITFLPALLAVVKHRIGVTTRAAMISLVVFILSAFISVISSSLPVFLIGLALTVAINALSFVVKSLRKPIPHRIAKAKELTFWYR